MPSRIGMRYSYFVYPARIASLPWPDAVEAAIRATPSRKGKRVIGLRTPRVGGHCRWGERKRFGTGYAHRGQEPARAADVLPLPAHDPFGGSAHASAQQPG